MTCKHEFRFDVEVHCFEDREPFAAVDIVGACSECGASLEFLGLECGVNLNGAAVSPDHREARLSAVIVDGPATIRESGMKVRM